MTDIVEVMARSTCDWAGLDPEEMMPDGEPRWKDRAECMAYTLSALREAGYAVVPREATVEREV